MSDAMPVLYLSHGAPPLADDARWTGQLANWASDLPKPRAILVVSAHWEAAPLTIGATSTRPLVYDFWGFPERYYQVSYPAPGAPELAGEVRNLLGGEVAEDPSRGLDHGAYVPLVEMFPAADVPVLQVSMPTLDPRELHRIGQRLAPLRDSGVLIVGSGFFTHNLREMNPMSGAADAPPPGWSVEFDHWGDEVLVAGDIDALLDFQHKAPAPSRAHPRTEHFAPLFVALGAGEQAGAPRTVVDGFWYGLAKRSVQLG